MAPIFQQPPATPGIQGTIPPSANHRSHHRLWDRKIQWHGRRPHSHPSPSVVLKRIGQNTIYSLYIYLGGFCFNFGKTLLNVSGLKNKNMNISHKHHQCEIREVPRRKLRALRVSHVTLPLSQVEYSQCKGSQIPVFLNYEALQELKIHHHKYIKVKYNV